MDILHVVLMDVILLVFPLIFNLFFCMYSKELNKDQSMAILDFALLSSLYLLISYNDIENNISLLLLFNVPLIISYMKQRSFVAIIISIIIVCIYYTLDFNIIIFILEYVSFYLIYLFTLKTDKFLPLYFIFKTVFSLITYFFYMDKYCIVSNLIMYISFIIIIYLILYMYKKGEGIIKLHMDIKELEKDKQIRTSLFKITHEIKNPIAVCKSYLDMFDINNKSHDKYITIVKEEIEKILLLLQDFLSMNKIKIQKEILDINMLLEDVVDQFELILKEKNIELKTNISQDEVFVEGDYNRLNQVLINMIKNSVEALDNQNKPLININYEIIDNNFKIIIKDNGSGISEEDLKRIKEPFYTTKKNGTGLGVSLSQEIIEAHNGTLDYFSKKNKGTKVIITLPIYKIFN